MLSGTVATARNKDRRGGVAIGLGFSSPGPNSKSYEVDMIVLPVPLKLRETGYWIVSISMDFRSSKPS